MSSSTFIKTIYVAGMILSTSVLSMQVNAQNTQATPVRFQHGEWELACDNTRTCRAVGYQDEDAKEKNPVALMLKRNAGANQRVRASVMFADDPTEDATKIPHCTASKPTISINGQDFGVLGELNNENYSYELSTQQTHALINTLPTSSHIEFVDNCYKYVVSDTGSTAVLLKMDEVQGRIDTKGAIIKRGNKPESTVLQALPIPKVQIVTIDDKKLQRVSDKKLFTRFEQDIDSLARQTLSTSQQYAERDNYCPALTEPDEDRWSMYEHLQDWDFYRLNDQQLLAQHGCWSGAYNRGYGYWLMNDKPPYDVTLITDSGVYYKDGEIFYGHKSRGMGDCWSMAEWRFAQATNGNEFVKTSESTTGMCKSIAAGGAFNLPTIVTEVVEK